MTAQETSMDGRSSLRSHTGNVDPTGQTVIQPGYLRKEEAAQYLNISIRTLSDWMRDRIVPYVKISHRVCLFKITELDRALDRYRVKAAGEKER